MSLSNREKIDKKIDTFIKKNKKIYTIISRTEDFSLIAKRKKLTVYTINENNIFQPHEKNEEKVFSVLFGVKYTQKYPKGLKDLLETGCLFIVINQEDNIEELFNKI